MSINKIPVADKKMARQWQKRWTFSNKPNMIYYHVFSPYGAGLDIVPEDVCHDVIERVLNPVAYDGYYTDKNNFDSLLPKDSLPKTIIRKMNGVYMDADYNKIQVDQDNLGGGILTRADTTD